LLKWFKMEESGVFYGEYSHTIDKKNRVIIPSKFRETLREKGIEKLYITRGLDKCLFMFPESQWKIQEQKFKAMPFTKSEVRKFTRQFFGGAQEIEPDRQWRILIPDYLKGYADLTRDIKILGVADRIEIWDIGKWEKFYGASRERYEEIAENLMDLE